MAKSTSPVRYRFAYISHHGEIISQMIKNPVMGDAYKQKVQLARILSRNGNNELAAHILSTYGSVTFGPIAELQSESHKPSSAQRHSGEKNPLNKVPRLPYKEPDD